MSAAMPAFDTYKYIRTLKEAGFTEAQAEAQSTALLQIYDAHFDRLVTKDQLTSKLDSLETRLNGRIDALQATVQGQGALLKWVAGSSMAGTISSVIGLGLFIAGKLA